MELTYTERNGILYPDLALPEQTHYPIGKYSKMRLEYFKNHRREDRAERDYLQKK